MQFDLMASMMCADYGNLEKEVKNLEEGGIDSFHIDIMDGRYVPNFAMSLIPPIHDLTEHHQHRDESRHCHQPGYIRGDRDGDAAHCMARLCRISGS